MGGPTGIDARSQTVQPTPLDFAQHVPDVDTAGISFPLGTTTLQFAISDTLLVKPEYRTPQPEPSKTIMPQASILDKLYNALSSW